MPCPQPIRHIGSNHNTVARPFPGFTGSQPSYSLGPRTLKSPLKDSADGTLSSPLSDAYSRSLSGSTSPGSGSLPHTSTNIALKKENAKNFLKMTLDKENVNTINVHSSLKSQKSSSNENLFTSQFLNNNGNVAGHQRKYSLASNTSSCSSSEADHDALLRRNNEVRRLPTALPSHLVTGKYYSNTDYL